MSVEEDGSASLVPQSDPVTSAGLEIAIKWGAALGGPANLEVAFKALEPQLVREHEALMRRLAMQEAASKRSDANAKAAAEIEARRAREERQHKRHLAGLYMGAAISIAMLGGGVYVAKDAWWLAVLLCGPSLVAMGKIFVLRRSDPGDMRAVSQVSRNAISAASQSQPPP